MDEISYRIRRSERARRVRVTVDATRGVEVVLPRRAPEREAAAAIRELAPWIERRLGELERARRMVAARGDHVPYLDELLLVVPQRGRTRVHRRGLELLTPGGADRVPALERWYKRAARYEIGPRLMPPARAPGARTRSSRFAASGPAGRAARAVAR